MLRDAKVFKIRECSFEILVRAKIWMTCPLRIGEENEVSW